MPADRKPTPQPRNEEQPGDAKPEHDEPHADAPDRNRPDDIHPDAEDNPAQRQAPRTPGQHKPEESDPHQEHEDHPGSETERNHVDDPTRDRTEHQPDRPD